MSKMRIDKLLSHMGVGSRKEIKNYAKQGLVLVNDKVVKNSGFLIDPVHDRVVFDGESIVYREFVYIMLNKPQGVISATEDARDQTVLDLLPDEYRHFKLFPVGRLDKDTEGLLLLTNDGKLAHDLLSPKKHVPKTYYADVNGIVTSIDIEQFKQGVTLDDGYCTMPANLVVLEHNKDQSKIQLTIREGKFHQVKRMFEAVGKKVIFLKRLSMGHLMLDPNLSSGEFRECTQDEIDWLKQGWEETI